MAELRLDVTLNLPGFRSQLGKLAQVAAAYYYPVNILINKKNLTKQLEAIGRNLGTKQYSINLNDTSVGIAADKVEKLAASLKKLSGSIKIDINAGGGAKSIGTSMKEMAAKLAKESRGDIDKASERMKEMRGSSPFGSGTRSVPGFKSAAKGMGIESAFKLFFQELKQVDPQTLRKALDDGSVMMMGENRELKQKFDKIQSSAESLAQDLRAMGETAKATGKASLSTGGKTLYPKNYGLKISSLLSQIEKLDRDLRKVSAQSGTELLNNLTELTSVLRTTSNSFVGISGFSDSLDQTLRRFDTATKTATAATTAYTERINRRAGGAAAPPAGPRLLPGRAPGGALAVIPRGDVSKVIEVQVRSSFNIIEDYHKTQLDNFTRNYKKNIDAYHKAILTQQLISQASVRNAAVRPAIVIEGGRPLLPAAAERKMLPAESGLSAFKRAVNGAVNEYFKSVGHGPLNQGAMPPLPKMPLMLPAAGETTAGLNRPRIRTGSFGEGFASPFDRNVGYVPPGGFPSETKMPGGKQGPSAFIGAGSQMEKFKTAIDVASASTRNFSASQLPLIGGLKGIAGEFGQAAKQVLLYGAAYKGLAFITSLPGQILNAAKSQQQFNNGLKVATQETGTFAKELLFIDNVQRAFGLNLETTRTGFTRLYASMAPTGFDSGSIEKLFTGISAATAALQLTPDKAERVIYAFGQMASKGQIMSEELKGQLGDVLPGALAIFSKAAGMSVKEFSKAMEDGAFTGNRFREVFAKVSDELINRFGTGAQVAGRSLQGLINTVGGDFQRTLESFAPLANAAAQATLGPLTGMLREVSMAAQLAMGEQDRVIKQLKAAQADVSALKIGGADAKEIKAAEQNVAALAAKYEVLNEAARDTAIAQQVKNIEAFVAEVQKAATFTMNLAGVIGNVLSPFLSVLGGNFTSVIGSIALLTLGFTAMKLAALLVAGTLTTINAVVLAGGSMSTAAAARHTILAGVFGLLGVQATGAQIATIGFGVAIKGLLISSGIGAVVLLLGSLAAAFLSTGNKAKEAADRSKQSIESMVDAARTGNVSMIEMELSYKKTDQQDLENLITKVEKLTGPRFRGKGEPLITLPPDLRREADRLKANVPAGLTRKSFLLGSLNDLRPSLKDDIKQGELILQDARKRADRLKLNKPDPTSTTAETEDDKKRKAEEERQAKLQDTLATRQQQLDQDAANRRAALDQSTFDSRLRMSDAEYNHQRALQDSHFEREISGLDSIEARQKKFQQDLKAIENRRIDSIRKAELDAVKAVQDLRSATVKAGAVTRSTSGGTSGGAGGVVATTGGARNQDPVTRGSSTGEHLHAQAANMTEKTLQYLVDKYLEIGGQTATSFGQSRGSAGHGYNAIDFLTPQNTPIKLKGGASISQYGPAGGNGGLMGQVSTPEGNFQLGHLTSLTPAQGSAANLQSSSVGLNTRSGAFTRGRREDKATGNLELEQQEVLIKQSEKLLAVRYANQLAIEETATRIKQNLDSIFPIKEQQLENDLLELRNKLELDGTSKEIIDMEIEKTKKTKESAISVKNLTTNMLELTTTLDAYSKKKILTEQDVIEMNRLTKQIILLEEAIAALPGAQRQFNDELARTAKLTKAGSFGLRIKALKDEIKLLATVDDAERRVLELTPGGSTSKEAQQIYSLEKVKKNLEDTKALVGSFVSSTVSDYKGFLKAVISGEDAVDALKKFQEGLTDKVLTIFLDFTMAPVEEMMKKSLEKLFMPKVNVAEVPITANTTELAKNTIAINNNTTALGGKALAGSIDPMSSEDFSNSVPVKVQPFVSPESAFGGFDTEDPFAGLNDQIRAGLAEIPSSFAEATANLQISSEPFKQALITDLPNALTTANTGVQTQGALFGEGLTNFVGGLGVAAAGITGIAAGISQIGKGGTSNVLGGIGSILMGAGGAIGGFGKLFGVKGFANGGMVTRPTLGMVGEGRFNEAIVPLPNGRSIPVQLNQDSSLRSAMGSNNSNNATAPVLNMSFETTRIGNTDYVSREQLEAAMLQTRAEATRAGARRGMTMTLDKLQQSPSTRSRVGIG